MATTTTTLSIPTPPSAKALELAKSIKLDIGHPEAILSLGAAVQQQSTHIADQLLAHARNKDTGEAGSLLSSLSLKCKGIDCKKLQPSGWHNTIISMPFIGKFLSNMEAELSSYDKTVDDLGKVSGQLTTAAATITADIQSLNTLYDENLALYQDLRTWAEVGRIKLQELDTQLIPAAQTKAATDPNTMNAQILSDLRAYRDRLDRRVNDLELTATIRMQQAPGIRLIQAGDFKLTEKLQSGVLNTIPLWKDLLTRALTEARQKKAADLCDAVDDTTNALLRSSADATYNNSVQIAKTSNRGVVDIDTLKYAQDKLLAAIDETRHIAEEGVKQREQTRIELEQLRTGLQQKLMS